MTRENSIKKCFLFRFYAELNDFLPLYRRQRVFEEWYKTPICVGDTMVSLGVPFSEVDLILVNGTSVGMNHMLCEYDRISVYPKFESLDISANSKLRERPLRESKFILDCHLGKLARYLRMLGFDCLYKNHMDDDVIIEIAKRDDRIILTRDKLLLKSSRITHGYFVRAIEKHAQLKEVVEKFDLYSQFKSFSRCMTCNHPLQAVSTEEILHKIDEDTAQIFQEFYLCPDCDKVFWKGSHFKRMEEFVRRLVCSRNYSRG
ncbi:Mut7-C RNAse domain-containing protein [Marinifilum fragile]|uniref:Mut7-C RNAse domain-containing protein n=1 Tax=Marinifilum fragile TaxID=570161 RepID=UPI002AAB8E5A|nr:Mut7-C RNAse domain-containing protein [Marinifilum fragile]